MERVIIDMDEVIADTMGKMIHWYEKEYGNGLIDYGKMEMGRWSIAFPEQHQSMIRQRLNEPGFFRDVPVMEGSQEVLKEMNRQYEVFIVSAAIEFPDSLKDKYEWLMEHFPFLSWRQLVLCGDKRMVHGDHMIDDIDRNLLHFPGKKYLFSAPHNLSATGFQRINNWEEAASIFLK
jgi:5'(3')-deoxyribonucleotidase